MLDGTEMLKLLVGLKQAGDIDLAWDEEVLATVCEPQDQPRVHAMAAIVHDLLGAFDYAASPEYLATREKLLTPEKQREAAARCGRSLTELLTTNEAYALIPAARHPLLDELKRLAASFG
ncbi:hypothetical protein [Blastopirellula marina]|uniref:Uncharacterized protein n=1 Tax=Blastopirellula marina TaxID=124 RepID=A0A2S8F3F7_9BACT|nr:hypothetical protein [Blastopirellula marina]PQO26657.1 hypothetical protein C5Y98_30215 [Blastopirellula marina]PTL40968.1 hypothetical protein C5Y97_30230 [Blastopirellula marina]